MFAEVEGEEVSLSYKKWRLRDQTSTVDVALLGVYSSLYLHHLLAIIIMTSTSSYAANMQNFILYMYELVIDEQSTFTITLLLATVACVQYIQLPQ